MGIRSITRAELAGWEKSYTNHLRGSEVTEETRSCLLSLEELKTLVAYIDQKNPTAKIDGIEIYLTRSPECDDESKVNKIASKGGIYQISFAIVPLVGTEPYFEKDDSEEKTMCLYAGKQDKSATGLCPPCSKKATGDKKNSS